MTNGPTTGAVRDETFGSVFIGERSPGLGKRQAATSSREIDWYTVAAFVNELTEDAADVPLAGTPDWCALAADDPRKIAAVLTAGSVWALEQAMRQEELVAASRAVSDAEDWSAFASRMRSRHGVYIERVA